jgi:hypothetical protein
MKSIKGIIETARQRAEDSYDGGRGTHLLLEEALAQIVQGLEQENDWFYDLLVKISAKKPLRVGRPIVGRRFVEEEHPSHPLSLQAATEMIAKERKSVAYWKRQCRIVLKEREEETKRVRDLREENKRIASMVDAAREALSSE